MAEVTPSRSQIQEEDVAYRRSVSESILTKVGAQSNFINSFQVDSHRWVLNGSYQVATGIELFDGLKSFFYNAEITGIYFWVGQVGTSGTTEFDIEWLDASGTNMGSIFSTNPEIATTASNVSRGFENYVTTTTSYPTGFTQPVLSKTTFLEGESIFMKLNSAQASSTNCGIAIYWRPIN